MRVSNAHRNHRRGRDGDALRLSFGRRCDVTMLDDNAAVAAAVARDGLRLNDEPARAWPLRSAHATSTARRCSFFSSRPSIRCARCALLRANSIRRRRSISLQNGIGNEDAIKTALGGAVPVILGITTESSQTHRARPRAQLRRRQYHHRIDERGRRRPRAPSPNCSPAAACALRSSTTFARICGVSSSSTPRSTRSRHCSTATRARFHSDPNAARLAEALAEETASVAAALQDQPTVRQSLAVRHGGRRARRRRKELDGLRSGFGSSQRDRPHQRRGGRLRPPHRHADAL